MIPKRILGELILVFLFAGAAIAATQQISQQARDTYWISFISVPKKSSDNLERVFLMKIDSIGNIVAPPKMVVTTQNTTTALQPAPKGNIHLWMNERDGGLVRMEIDKAVKVVKTTPIRLRGKLNGVTQKENNNFLFLSLYHKAFSHQPAILLAARISGQGVPTGTTWQISSVQDSINCGEGISADGKTAFWFPWFLFRSDYLDSLTIQPLNNSSRTAGKSIVKLERDEISCGAAVSNATPSGEKFVVWKYNESAESNESSELFLQSLDSETGQPLTEKIVLRTVIGNIGDLSIDPFGHFVVFSEQAIGKPDALLFQALDITGHASGSPRVLLEKSLPFGLSILKNTENKQ